jgi:hypothetical protein
VLVRCVLRFGLHDVPVLDKLPVLQTKEVRCGPAAVFGRGLKQAVCHNQVALGGGAVELDAQLGEQGRNGLYELNEAHALLGRSVNFFVGAVF